MRGHRRAGHHGRQLHGQTYYVCCGGCRDAFNENPAQIIKEYLAKKKKGGIVEVCPQGKKTDAGCSLEKL